MASSCLNWLESIEEWSKKWDKISHQKSNKSDIDDGNADESHINLRGERDVIRLRNPTEDKRAFRRILTSADHPWSATNFECSFTFNLSVLANELLSVSLFREIDNVFGAVRTCFDHVLSTFSGFSWERILFLKSACVNMVLQIQVQIGDTRRVFLWIRLGLLRILKNYILPDSEDTFYGFWFTVKYMK